MWHHGHTHCKCVKVWTKIYTFVNTKHFIPDWLRCEKRCKNQGIRLLGASKVWTCMFVPVLHSMCIPCAITNCHLQIIVHVSVLAWLLQICIDGTALWLPWVIYRCIKFVCDTKNWSCSGGHHMYRKKRNKKANHKIVIDCLHCKAYHYGLPFLIFGIR